MASTIFFRSTRGKVSAMARVLSEPTALSGCKRHAIPERLSSHISGSSERLVMRSNAFSSFPSHAVPKASKYQRSHPSKPSASLLSRLRHTSKGSSRRDIAASRRTEGAESLHACSWACSHKLRSPFEATGVDMARRNDRKAVTRICGFS